jgi:putative membrane fusion protein
MKTKTMGTKVLMALICLIVLIYFGIQVYRYYSDPLTTTVAYSYQEDDTTAVSGWVVRDETILTGSSDGVLRLARSEGERVSKGGKVAVIYTDQASVDTEDQIDTLETQIAQMEYAQESAASNEVSLKLDSQITSGILNMQRDLAADRMEAAGEHQSELRMLVLKRDYTYEDNADLAGQIKELQSQLKSLRAAAASGSRTVTSPASGIYSAVVDGYETVLTPDSLEDVTPTKLAGVQPDSAASSPFGKIILGDTWYYAATMTASEAASLKEGRSLTLRFAKTTDRDLTVRVVSVSAEESGRVAVVFSGRQYLPELTLLRQQSGEVINGSVTGLRVPSNAIRVDEDGVSGVYCLVGVVARFKPVTVVHTGDNFALVRAAAGASGTNCLRAGDEVIAAAGNLADGKVVG